MIKKNRTNEETKQWDVVKHIVNSFHWNIYAKSILLNIDIINDMTYRIFTTYEHLRNMKFNSNYKSDSKMSLNLNYEGNILLINSMTNSNISVMINI